MGRSYGIAGLMAVAVAALAMATGADSAAAACANRGMGDQTRVQQREVAVLCEANTFRTARGLAPLHLDTTLSGVARAHAKDMAIRGYFDHVTPENRTFADRINGSGYGSYAAAAENIAMGYSTPAEVVQGWIDSPGHRANLLGTAYRDIGVGIYGNYYVQLFAGPGHSKAGITGLEPEFQEGTGPPGTDPPDSGPAVTGFVIQRFAARSYRISAGNATGQRLRVEISRKRRVCAAARSRRRARCVLRWSALRTYAVPVVDGSFIPIRAGKGMTVRIRFVLSAFTSAGISYPGYAATVLETAR